MDENGKNISKNAFYGAMVYFVIAALIMFTCAAGIIIFMKMPYVQYYVNKATNEKNKTHRRISGVRDGYENDSDYLLGKNEINKSGMSNQLSS